MEQTTRPAAFVMYSCPLEWVAIEGPKVPLIPDYFLHLEHEGELSALLGEMTEPVRVQDPPRGDFTEFGRLLFVERRGDRIFSIWAEYVPLPQHAYMHSNRWAHTASQGGLISQIRDNCPDPDAAWDRLLPEFRGAAV